MGTHCEQPTPEERTTIIVITSEPKPPHPQGRGRWVVVLLIGIFLLFGWLFWQMAKVMTASIFGFVPPQMVAAQYTPKDVVGDLGGMTVLIPRHMAEYVEYEGDTGWAGKRDGLVPERTSNSKLTSFRVRFRYPDMATLSGPEMWRDMKSKTIRNTDWMDFGITSGENYLGNGALDRNVRATLADGLRNGKFIYVPQPPDPAWPSLQKYSLVDKATGLPPTEKLQPSLIDDVFVARNSEGRVTSMINCSKYPVEVARCYQHRFSLEWDGVHALVYINYRRDYLPHWARIQEQVRQKILGFRVTPE